MVQLIVNPLTVALRVGAELDCRGRPDGPPRYFDLQLLSKNKLLSQNLVTRNLLLEISTLNVSLLY